jgi:uncharacterized protein (DUF849 family)
MSMLLQASLNGDRARADHPAVPITPAELARAARACAAAGAGAVHVHPRDVRGNETLDPEIVNAVVAQTQAASGLPVGVTTDAGITPDVEERLTLVRRWRAPDYASVNVSDAGSLIVMRTLLDAGVGIEAGVWTVEDAERLASSGLGPRLLRILVEPVDVGAAEGVAVVRQIHRTLDRLGLSAPRLQHGDSDATWTLLVDAIRRGLDTRIGLEDTLTGPDGARTVDNAALVQAARALGAGER